MTGSALNIVLKLIAVILAVFLWFNVITQKQYEHELTLAVTDVELPPTLGTVTPFPDSLTVRVLAEGKKLLRDDWKDAGVRIKAGRLKRGMNNLELNIETVGLVRSEDVTVLDLAGAAPLTIQLDRLDSILIPVASRLAVIPREGFMIISGREEISPLRTQVVGPGLTIRRIDSIYTEQKIIDDADQSVQVTLALQNPEDTEIYPAHDSAMVEVPVDRIKRKKFDNVPITVGRVGRIIVDPARVTIEVDGPESMIDSLTVDQIRVVVTPAPGAINSYVAPQIIMPANFTAKSFSPDSIHVLVTP